MAYNIIWSDEAIKTFDSNIIFLEREWNKNVVKKFVVNVFNTIETIQLNPLLYKQFYKTKRIRSAIITKQITLFYRINKSKKVIELITFWNNHKDPKKLKW